MLSSLPGPDIVLTTLFPTNTLNMYHNGFLYFGLYGYKEEAGRHILKSTVTSILNN